MSNIEDKKVASSTPVDLKDPDKPILDKLGRAYATGRRKTSVSRVWIKFGQPKIVVNGKPVEKYFLRKIYSSILEAPLSKTDNLDKVEIASTVSGGGLSGQAGAIRHGISRALVNLDPSLRKKLKKMGFLTRDARKWKEKNLENIKPEEVLSSLRDKNAIKCLYFWCVWLYRLQIAFLSHQTQAYKYFSGFRTEQYWQKPYRTFSKYF